MRPLIDLSRELQDLAQVATGRDDLDSLLATALDALEAVVPYDLASVLELDGETLRVRVARGPLASSQVAEHSIELADFPTVRRSLQQRRPIAMLEHHHAGEEGDPYHDVVSLPDGHSCMVVPLFAGDRTLGAMTFDRGVCEPYADDVVRLAGVYGQLVGLAFQLADQAQVLDRARRALSEQNRLLREDLGSSDALLRLARTSSPTMKRLTRQIEQVAPTDAPVLVLGETGVGKEVVAQAIHEASRRRSQAFVKLNCAALPENLVESELFGHSKGAFSGATATRAGRFSTANGGTLLLDEVGELPAGAQAKLLRVLQEGTFEPVGSDRTVRVDVRIVAATHIDLEAAVRSGRFREDLYYRLAVFPLTVPPLRDRLEDLEALGESVLGALAQRSGRGPWWLSAAALRRLRSHSWPGNVRELVNALERATILEPAGELQLSGFSSEQSLTPLPTPPSQRPPRTLVEVERDAITEALRFTHGKLYGDDGAAKLLGLKPSTLQSRMKKLGVQRLDAASS